MSTKESKAEFYFSADGERLRGVRWGDPASPAVVFLHGAGESNVERLEPFAYEVVSAGFSGWSFDFSGHGKSTGVLSDLSLQRRQAQALALAALVAEHSSIVGLCGSSMSGQTVSDISNRLDPRAVCLVCPAAYAADASSVQFGAGFTELIRRPRSWATSLAYGEIASFLGGVVLVTAGRDAVIPDGVTERYLAAGRNRTAGFAHVHFENAPHTLGQWMKNNEADRVRAAQAFISLLRDEETSPAPEIDT